MNEIHRNRLLAEYSRAELEEDFIRCCEELDQIAPEIKKLEDSHKSLQQRLARVDHDIDDQTKQQICFDGAHAPMVFRQAKLQAQELSDQLTGLDRTLAQREARRDKVLQEVKYFRSLLNFPSKKMKTYGPRGEANYTRAQLARMLSKLLAENRIPQMADRLQAAIAILNGKFEDASTPMRRLMDAIGESLPFFQILDLRQSIQDREEKIEQQRAALADLKARHEEMTKRHQDNLAQYQREAEENNRMYKELLDLQHDKESKEAEATQLAELRIKIDDLKQQIALLEEQNTRIAAESAEKLALLERQRDEELARLRAELEELAAQCAALRAATAAAQAELEKISAQCEDEQRRVAEIRDAVDLLKREFQAISERLAERLRGIGEDPFVNDRFIKFLQDLSDRRWKYTDIRDMQKHISEVERDIAAMREKQQKYQEMYEKLAAALARKTEQMERLKQETDELQRKQGIEDRDRLHSHEAVYTDGTNHVRVETQVMDELESDQTAITIEFRDFTLSPGILKPNHRKIFLLVDFLGFEPIYGTVVDVSSGTFETTMLFKRKNDYDLADYLEKQGPRVELCARLGAKYEPVAAGVLDLRPFLRGESSFSARLQLSDHERPAGEVSFEALIYRELIRSTPSPQKRT
jgi:DNA repair exonuclease SbcCD ATPase subunit